MATINGDTAFTLDGATDFTIGGTLHEWEGNFLGYVSVFSGTLGAAYDVDVSLTGPEWSLSVLRFTGAADLHVAINDDAFGTKRHIGYVEVGTPGGSIVNLITTSVDLLQGGAGVDDITLGSETCGALDLRDGDDVVHTGSGWVGSINLGHGTNTIVTAGGFVDSIFGFDGTDTVILGAGGAQVVSTGNGDDVVHTGSGWVGSINLGQGTNTIVTAGGFVDSIFAYHGADTITIGAGGAGAVNAGEGNNRVTSSTGWVGSIVTYNGNDTVTLGKGGAGSIALLGGNDTYNLGAFSTTIIDNAGTDTITSTISRSLVSYATIDNLTLVNISTALAGTGNNLNNVITGNNFANTLSGGIGNDTLRGGNGNDSLFGGAGIDTLTGGLNNDFFVFNTALNTATNRDIVTDFYAPQDTFRLENAVFTKLGALAGVHALNPAYFRAATTALDANDYIVYNRTAGTLYYDANANAAGGAIAIAALTNHPVLTASDFVVI